MKITETSIRLNTDARDSEIIVPAKQLDDNTRFIKALIFNGPIILDLMYVKKAFLNATKPDGNETQYECLLNTTTNEITFSLPQQLLAIHGDAKAEIAIEMDDKSVITTGTFTIRVEQAAITGSGFESEKDYSTLIKALDVVDERIAALDGVVYSADRIIQDPLHRFVTDVQLSNWDAETGAFPTMINMYTKFSADGSITQTDGSGNLCVTSFLSNGDIQEQLTKADGSITTKTTHFNADGSITEVVS